MLIHCFSDLSPLNSETVFVEFTNKIHGRVARHVSPLAGGHHLCTVLVIVGIVRLALSPFAKGGHGRAVHISEDTLHVQVVDADVDSA